MNVSPHIKAKSGSALLLSSLLSYIDVPLPVKHRSNELALVSLKEENLMLQEKVSVLIIFLFMCVPSIQTDFLSTA